nr:hypothetical protein [Tanacetum cinerariifolium]
MITWREYVGLPRIVKGWQSASIARLSNLHEQKHIINYSEPNLVSWLMDKITWQANMTQAMVATTNAHIVAQPLTLDQKQLSNGLYETVTNTKEKELNTGHCRQVPFNKGSIPLTSDIIQIPSRRVNGQITLGNLKATSARLTKRERIDVADNTQHMITNGRVAGLTGGIVFSVRGWKDQPFFILCIWWYFY